MLKSSSIIDSSESEYAETQARQQALDLGNYCQNVRAVIVNDRAWSSQTLNDPARTTGSSSRFRQLTLM